MIRSASNKLVKQAIALKTPRTRAKERRVLIEGRKAVADALAAGAHVSHALVAPGFEGEPLLALDRAGVPVQEVAAPLFEKIAATETSQGIAAVAEEPRSELEVVLGAPGDEPLAVFDRIQDPGNLGTALRTAAALGFRGALLARGTADPWNPKVVRASAATLFRLPVVESEDIARDLGLAEERGFAVVCAAPGGDAPRRAFEAVRGRRAALVVGNEGQGIAPEILARAKARVWIPLAREVESLNAAIAFSILAYELRREMAWCR